MGFLRSGADAAAGKKVDFQAYMNETAQEMKMFAHFGAWTEGPIDHVHGGAISAMADTAMGVCITYAGYPCVTAQLVVNYRAKVPLLTTALLESKITDIDGRKIHAMYTMTDLESGTTYSEGHALFVQLKDTNLDPKHIIQHWEKTDW